MRCTNYNQIEIKNGLKGILEVVPPRKNTGKASQNVFLRLYRDFKKFAVISSVLRTVFTNEIVIKFVFNKINLNWHSKKSIIMLFFVAFLN